MLPDPSGFGIAYKSWRCKDWLSNFLGNFDDEKSMNKQIDYSKGKEKKKQNLKILRRGRRRSGWVPGGRICQCSMVMGPLVSINIYNGLYILAHF